MAGGITRGVRYFGMAVGSRTAPAAAAGAVHLQRIGNPAATPATMDALRNWRRVSTWLSFPSPGAHRRARQRESTERLPSGLPARRRPDKISMFFEHLAEPGHDHNPD
jgi:hypothetical protein